MVGISNKTKERTKRLSNFELCRIITMFLIVLHHLLIKGAETCGYTSPYSIQKDGIIGLCLNGLAIVSVNVFILISGWFGMGWVKKIQHQIIRLVLDCIVYGTTSYVSCLLVFGFNFNIKELVRSELFIYNWFVVSFIILVLVAPMLEKILANATNKEMLYYFYILTIVNIIFGYIGGNLNVNGYNVLNFIYLYFIARILRCYSDTVLYKKIFRYGLLIWIAISLLLAVGFIFYSEYVPYSTAHTMRYFAYNNPLVLLSSVSFFAWFSLLKIQRNWINNVARGTFGVFLYIRQLPFNLFVIYMQGQCIKIMDI